MLGEPMAVNLAQFENPLLKRAMACAVVAADDVTDNVRSLLKDKDWVHKESSYQTASGKIFALFGSNWVKSDNPNPAEGTKQKAHFHLEFFHESEMKEPPTDLCGFDEFVRNIELFNGIPLSRAVEVRYAVPLANLNRASPIRPMLDIDIDIPPSRIKMTGGRFDVVSEGPMARMVWFVRKESEIVVDLKGSSLSVVGEEYINEIIISADPLFRSFFVSGNVASGTGM